MPAGVVYWDGAAVTAALLRRPDSERALAVLREPVVHLVPTLAWVEALAEAARLVRDGALTREQRNAVTHALERGPWRLTYACPRRSVLEDVVAGPYDAATRWHLATAQTLSRRLPELRVLALDAPLRALAETHKLAID